MLVFVVLLILLSVNQANVLSIPPYPNALAACDALSSNTSALITFMHGFGWTNPDGIKGYSRNSGCGGVCGNEFFRWDNGPQGFGDHSGPGNSTQFPSSLNLGATFDPSLALTFGQALGQEFWDKGTNIYEGPGVNIARNELNGRTFEYLSGEDPVLGARLAVPLVQGVQEYVMAIGKHYIANNQETDRSGENNVIDERTMMELYSPAFAAMAPYVAGYMCAYNRINGDYACENNHTLNIMLKGYFNFSGFVVSDWGATHSTAHAINNGLDIDMPDDRYFSEVLIKQAVENGNVTVARLKDSCVRILSQWYNLPQDKRSIHIAFCSVLSLSIFVKLILVKILPSIFSQ